MPLHGGVLSNYLPLVFIRTLDLTMRDEADETETKESVVQVASESHFSVKYKLQTRSLCSFEQNFFNKMKKCSKKTHGLTVRSNTHSMGTHFFLQKESTY